MANREKSSKKKWQKIFSWGQETASKLNIKTEEDILKLIND